MSEALPFLILRSATRLVEGIQAGMVERGFDDVRPSHGFAFTVIAGGGATTVELARHLGVSKQAASQMVHELESKGYVRRVAHPEDARAKLVVLTERGVDCTRAATGAGQDALDPWLAGLDPEVARQLVAALATYAGDGPIRPTW
jgi:DNA-binding MarR family transcriptional regulator